MTKVGCRIEKDALGEKEIPEKALYGIASLRAKENFQIYQQLVHPALIEGIIWVKKACALANLAVGKLSNEQTNLILKASDEILNGKFKEAFITEAIQGGAGTSINMNVNEVIANRAAELAGLAKGEYQLIHPNDQVNLSQSTNDVIPSAGKYALLTLTPALLTAIDLLIAAFQAKSVEYHEVIKVGRTHLQDAVFITFGQIFQSYQSVLTREKARINQSLNDLSLINLGATAVGTGINSAPGYAKLAVKNLSDLTGIKFQLADDLVDATKHVDSFVAFHSSLKNFALSLSRMMNDLRLMASGPRNGLNEISLPAVQPGSSIMPGKVNPVILEVVNQVCFKVIGNDTTVSLASEAGQMELNVFEPVMLVSLFESVELLTNALNTLTTKAIRGLTVNSEACLAAVEHSLASATGLVKKFGYTQVSTWAKQALNEKRSIKEVVGQTGLISEVELDELLNPTKLV